MALLEVSDLTVTLQGASSSIALVEGISFAIERGETLCVVGESGSGKTVTALTIMRLLEYVAPVEASGRVVFDGIELRGVSQRQMAQLRGRRLAMVFQECMEALNPIKRVGAQLEEMWNFHHDVRDASGAADARDRAVQMLRDVGMPDPEVCLGKYPHQLSGGMQQRTMIAMALMCDPELLIADEPTTALDVTIQAEILHKLRRLQRDRDMASLLITHNMGIAAELADRIAVMYAGRIVEIGPAARLLGATQHPYTAGLLACVPRPGQRQDGRLPTIPGNLPGPSQRPVGCRFAPRCERATELCRTTEPSLTVDNGGHAVACWHPLAPSASGSAGYYHRSGAADVTVERGQPGDVLVRLDDVSKIYPRSARARLGDRPIADLEKRTDVVIAVDHVSLDLHRNEVFGLVGETGSGKTTMGRLIGKLEKPTAGTITLGRVDLASLRRRRQEKVFRRRVQMVFQDPYASIDPRFTVDRVVGEPLNALTDQARYEKRSRVQELIRDVGLPASVLNQRVDELSGGQRQRVAIARATAIRPDVIVADEPTSALDVSVQGQVMNVLLEVQRDLGLTYLLISHNLSLVLSVADRVGVMYRGAIVEVAPAAALAAGSAHPYTAALLEANPDPDAPRHGFEDADPGIGEAETSLAPFDRGGCRFLHRCPNAADRCSVESPLLRPVGLGHQVACHFPLTGIGKSSPVVPESASPEHEARPATRPTQIL